MTRIMYDSVTVAHVPDGGDLYAGYVNGRYANIGALRARFPGKTIVTITVNTSADAEVLDVEPGDATPADAPAWVQRQRERGGDPTVYCMESSHSAVRASFRAAGVAEPHYWIAHYDGVAVLPAGDSAKQYGGDLPGNYDVSVVDDYWPGVDPAPTPSPQEETVLYTTVHATPAGTVATFKGLDKVTDVPVDPAHFTGIKSKTPARYEDGVDGKSIVVYADPEANIIVTFT